ncbi:MAG: hemolysin, partial [bacterium]|nr:hemolysin [bacterium]
AVVRARSTERGIFVYGDRADNWVATRRVWNQQGYHVTNVRDDLSIPEHEPENWLVEGLNNHRAQARAADEESPWAAPDLSVSALVVDPVGCPVQAVLSVRIGNGGANLAPPATVAFYAGDPSWGAPLLGLAATGAALAPG